MNDIHADFMKSEDDCEVIKKTRNDYWIVGRKSDQREFFVILNHRHATLIEIHEEVKKLSSVHFNNIFFG